MRGENNEYCLTPWEIYGSHEGFEEILCSCGFLTGREVWLEPEPDGTTLLDVSLRFGAFEVDAELEAKL